MKTGGCFCGAIRYSLNEDDYKVVNCHCTMCRRTSGAPFVSWLIVAREDFKITAGSPAILKSSESATRTFCNRCGTPVTCTNEAHASIVDVTLGSLDDPTSFTPDGDFYVDTRLSWVKTDDDK
jgi:hypothetical protein